MQSMAYPKGVKSGVVIVPEGEGVDADAVEPSAGGANDLSDELRELEAQEAELRRKKMMLLERRISFLSIHFFFLFFFFPSRS